MAALTLVEVAKSFTMHLQGGIRLPVVANVNLAVSAGECVVMAGPSGAGKSSILKMIYGSYRCDRGQILVRSEAATIDIAGAPPRQILALRRGTIGYVSQFLRAVPRVSSLDVVADGAGIAEADGLRSRAESLLRRLNIPERLWSLPPATFSGGEQQRINIARGFLPELPILLLDEPTASLDGSNRTVVCDLIAEKKRRGTAILAIVHDEGVRDAIADRIIDINQFAPAA